MIGVSSVFLETGDSIWYIATNVLCNPRLRQSVSAMKNYFYVLLLLFVTSCGLMDVASGTETCDVLFRNGTIHTGDGEQAIVADIAVKDGKIAAVGPKLDYVSLITIDCSDCIVAPGFIDLHTHSDDGLLERNTRSSINYLMQGCTTVVTGNCGMGGVYKCLETKTLFHRLRFASSKIYSLKGSQSGRNCILYWRMAYLGKECWISSACPLHCCWRSNWQGPPLWLRPCEGQDELGMADDDGYRHDQFGLCAYRTG